jgi:hypothetical protein
MYLKFFLNLLSDTETSFRIMDPLVSKYLNFQLKNETKKEFHFKLKKKIENLKHSDEDEKKNETQFTEKNEIKKESLSNSLEEKLANLRRNYNSEKISDSKQKKIRSLKQIDETEANQKIKEYAHNKKRKARSKIFYFNSFQKS